MLAVDTNILVRYLIEGDDPKQAMKARQLMADEEIFFPITVLLETEWVLRAKFLIGPEHIMQAFRALAGLRNVTIQFRASVLRATEWSAQGMDFADALHLAIAEDVEAFVTFDRDFAQRAQRVDSSEVRLL